MKALKIIAVCTFLSGCATAPPISHDTASGKAERQFTASLDRVHASLLTELVNRHYRITQDSQSLVVGEKPAENKAVLALYSTGMGPPVVRVTYSLIAQGTITRVVGDIMLVENAGTGAERRLDLNDSQASAEMQAGLNGLNP